MPFRLEAGCASVFNSAAVTHVPAKHRPDYCNSLLLGLPAGLCFHCSCRMQQHICRLIGERAITLPQPVRFRMCGSPWTRRVFVSHSFFPSSPLYPRLFFIIHLSFFKGESLIFFTIFWLYAILRYSVCNLDDVDDGKGFIFHEALF